MTFTGRRIDEGSGQQVAFQSMGDGTEAQAVVPVVGTSPVASGNGMPTAPEGINDGFAPFYEPIRDGTTSQMVIDPSGSIATRGMVLTDEGGFRGNFANASLAVTIGTCTFVNGSTTVTGTGFDQYDLHLGDYVYLTADGDTYAIQVDSVSADSLELVSAYAGPGGTGAGSRQYCRNVVGAGGSMAVSGGALTITCGTTATSVFELERDLDYLPLSCSGRFSISQRIANQDIYYGFYDENSGGTARWYYWFRFTGTTNTVVACECGWNPTGAPSGGEIATTNVTLPNGLTSATVNEYRVDVQRDRVVFIVNDTVLLVEKRVVPHPADFLTTTLRVVNGTTPASSTSVVCDMISSANFNVVSVDNPIKTAEIVAVPPNLDRQSYSVAGVIAINTVLLTLDCYRYKSFNLQCTSMGTTGVVTPEWSQDGTNWVGATIFTQAGASATTFNAAGMWIGNVMARYLRLRLSTATTAGTTTLYLDGCVVRQQFFYATQTVTATNLSCNAAQWAGQTPLNPATNGSTNRAIVAAMATAVSSTDQSATAFAGAGRVNGTIVAAATGGGGAVISAEINVSALTLGSATSVVPILQESRGGTNFTDIWVGDAMTATGIQSMPAIPVAGRRRWCFHSIGGTSTTVTVTITTLELPSGYVKQAYFRDTYAATNPLATVINSATQTASTFGAATALTATTQATSWCVVEGCKQLTAQLTLAGGPTVTTQPVVALEVSNDLSNGFVPAGATMTAAGNGTYSCSISGQSWRYARLRVTTAAAYSAGAYTITTASIYGTN